MKNFRWFIIALAFIATMINYIDRSALSYAITDIQQAFHLNNEQFGFIASGFGLGYIFMTVIGGILVDHYGARKIWSLSAILWSIMCGLFGLASGLWMFFILRFLLGITEGPAFPALTRVATNWLPISERARALGVGLAAVPFASVIGAPLVSFLIIGFGWRIMFIALGTLGILWGIIWYKYARDLPQQSPLVSSQELNHINNEPEILNKTRTSWKFILFNPSLMATNAAFFSFGYLLFFALTWLPGYLSQTYHINLKEIGLFLILPWLLGTLLILIGGFLSDWLWQKTKNIRTSRSHIIWICQIVAALCLLPVAFSHSLSVSIVFISLGIGIGLMPNAAFYAIHSDLAKDRVATSLGVMDCVFAAAGFLSPLITGWLIHVTHNFKAAILLLAGITFISALGIILFQHPDKTLQK